MCSQDSAIGEFLCGKTVFVTGGFGFVGKLLIEKLLRCDVKKIFCMVRSKKGKSIDERFEIFTNEPVFSKIDLSDKKKYFSRLHLIHGDLREIGFDISENDVCDLVEEVELFFHLAADVRFDENLTDAILANARGTREAIKLAKKLNNLKAFVYVSTSFSTPSLNAREKLYKPLVSSETMIKLVEKFQEEEKETFEVIAKRIIQPFPNTYTYSKSLAEDVLRAHADDMNIKIKIIRPSIITATYIEPLPGYTDNVYGLNGVLVGAGVGVIRILRIDNRIKSNIVPADYVVNLILAASFYTLESSDDSIKENVEIFNFSASEQNFVSWLDVKRLSTNVAKKFPMKKSLWIITYNTTRNLIVARILRIVYHLIPSLFFDSFLMICGKKPVLLKLYRKVNKFAEVLEFFTINPFNFDDRNTIKLWKGMTSADREKFNFNIWSIDWIDFFHVYCIGLRTFICKDEFNERNIKSARRKYNSMLVVHYLMLSALLYAFCKIFILFL